MNPIHISIIIFSVFILLLSYFFLNVNFSKFAEKFFEIKKIDIFENIKNIISSYSKLSLYYSATYNLRGESHTWIFNGFNPLEFEFLKSCKENITRDLFNTYLSKFYISLPLNININFTQKCQWNLKEEDVFFGKHDEGNFSLNCSEVEIIIFTNDTILLDKIEPENFITNNRYWYLYRKIYEWARENGDEFASCVCSLVSSCADCKSIDICYQNLFESLKEKFKDDEYVICRKTKPCCYRELGEPCIDLDGCHFWTKNICYLDPNYECPSIGSYFEKTFPITRVSSSNVFIYLTCLWIENRMETSVIYECSEHKYYESTPSGPDKLIFTIGVFAGWKNYKACKEIIKCYYDANNAKCENCNNNICEVCYLPFISCEKKPCYPPPKYMECMNCKVQCRNETCKVIKCEECKDKEEKCFS